MGGLRLQTLGASVWGQPEKSRLLGSHDKGSSVAQRTVFSVPESKLVSVRL